MERKEHKAAKRITTRVVLPDYIGITTFELIKAGAEVVLTVESTDPIKRDFGFKGVVDDNEVQDNFVRRHHDKTSRRYALAFTAWPKISLDEELQTFTCSTNDINNVVSFDEKIPMEFRPTRVWAAPIELIDGTSARLLVSPVGSIRIVSQRPMASKTGFKKGRLEYITSSLPESLKPVPLSRSLPDKLSGECVQTITAQIDLVQQKIGDVTQNQAVLLQVVLESLQKSITEMAEMRGEIDSLKKELAQLRTEHSHTSARIAHVESDIDACVNAAMGDEATQ